MTTKCDQLSRFREKMEADHQLLHPRLVVTLGRLALRKFFPGEHLAQIHGALKTTPWQGTLLHVFPVYHPAAALRCTQMRRALSEDCTKIPPLLAALLHV